MIGDLDPLGAALADLERIRVTLKRAGYRQLAARVETLCDAVRYEPPIVATTPPAIGGAAEA